MYLHGGMKYDDGLANQTVSIVSRKTSMTRVPSHQATRITMFCVCGGDPCLCMDMTVD